MENVIGWLLIAMVPTVIAVGGIYLYRAWKRDVERKEQEAIAQAEERAKQARERERQRAKEREEFEARLNGKTVKSTYDFTSDTIRTSVKDNKNNTTSYVTTPTHALAPTQSVSNWSNDLLTTMIISDMLTNHKDVSAGTVSWKDDTPTITETYSKPSTDFGMDDEDSRKSSSSSFSSSDSSSSWFSSDSSSSSSDSSGPSSDW